MFKKFEYLFTEVYEELVENHKKDYVINKVDISDKTLNKLKNKCIKEIGVIYEETEKNITFYLTKESDKIAKRIY